MQRTTLRNVEKQEGHHESEKTSSFSEGETQNGVLEELTPERWVAGDTLDEGTENGTDTNTSTSETDSGDTSTLDLGGGNHGGGRRLSNDATALDDVAASVVLEGIADRAVHDEAVLRGLDADGGCRRRVNGYCLQLSDGIRWGVPCVETKRVAGLPADWTERAATRAAPKDRAMATIVVDGE